MEKKQKKKLLVDYLHENLKQHNWWAFYQNINFNKAS